MTQLIFYASNDGELDPAATDKDFLSVHPEGGHEASGHAVSNHFCGVTKLIEHGKRGELVVNHWLTTAVDGNPMSALTTFHADIKNIREQGIRYTACSKLRCRHD